MNSTRTVIAAVTRLLAGLLVIGVVLILGSCFSLGGMAESAAYADDGYIEYDEDSFGAGADGALPMAAAERSAPAGSVPASPAGSGIAQTTAGGALPGEPPAEPDAEESEPSERLRVYSADLDLVVASVAESRDEIIGIVETAGGYVESSRADYLVVRVPAERFDPILEAIEETGEVRSRAVRTSDVTDQFFDLERRLRISEASRERLLQLLEQAEDPDERVAILRDIRRLTEEIEQLRSALGSLDQLIRFSRITIQLISRIQVSQIARQEIPFWWIAALSPLEFTTSAAGSDILITPDESFAVFDSGPWLFAEAADGTQFRAGAVTNEPFGDEEFWQSALIYHLGPFYRYAEPVESGEYRGVLLESKDTAPFYYLVLVHSRDDDLIVVEAFLPTSDAKDSRLNDILAAVAGGAE